MEKIIRFYKVHYPQTNQQYIYVEAESEEDARYKADSILRNSCPSRDEEPIEITKEEYEKD